MTLFNWRTVLTPLTLAAAVTTAVAGCTSKHPSAAGESSASAASSSATSSGTTKHPGSTSTAQPQKPKAIPTSQLYKVSTQPGTSKGYVGAARDVKLAVCTSRKGASSFSGTVTNPTPSAQSYRIYVSVIEKGNTVGIAEVDVARLAGKASARWKGDLGGGAPSATCVLRVERQAPAGT